MAHNINYNEQRKTHSLYSLKDIPWHGLGQIVAEAVTPDEALKLANLDYTVAKAPMIASFIPKNTISITPMLNCKLEVSYLDKSIKPYIERSIIIPHKGVEVPDIYCTYRTDNHEIFGPVGGRYEVVQNSQALEFIYDVIKSNDIIDPSTIVIETAGALGKGERIFVTAKLPSTGIKIEGIEDQYDRYVVFTTSHDGSTSVQAMFTNIRVVCNNTLNAAMLSAPNIHSFKHTRNVKQYMKEGALMMNRLVGYGETLNEVLLKASKTTVNDSQMYDFIASITLDDAIQKEHLMTAVKYKTTIDPDIISTRRLNLINNIINQVQSGVGQNVARGTMYNLYNGVTTYIANGVDYASNQDKFDSIMRTQGIGYKLNQKAMNYLLNVA